MLMSLQLLFQLVESLLPPVGFGRNSKRGSQIPFRVVTPKKLCLILERACCSLALASDIAKSPLVHGLGSQGFALVVQLSRESGKRLRCIGEMIVGTTSIVHLLAEVDGFAGKIDHCQDVAGERQCFNTRHGCILASCEMIM